MYTDQQQPQQINKKVVPNEVTFNPTDDTAHNDDLSNSFASNCCDYPHGAYYSLNQTGQPHHANQAHQMQHSQQMHPMLPPITPNELMDCQNCQMSLRKIRLAINKTTNLVKRLCRTDETATNEIIH